MGWMVSYAGENVGEPGLGIVHIFLGFKARF
jgi:hypothetical protein